MKNLIMATLILMVGFNVKGQVRDIQFEKSVSSDKEIFLNFKFANDIVVKQWDKSEVKVNASVHIDNGEGNEAFNLMSENSNEQFKIYSDFGDYWKNKNYYNSYDDSRSTWTTEIDYEVYIPKGAKLKVKSISGSLEALSFNGALRTDLISGDITLKKYSGQMKLKTVSGDVDVTMNKARIDAKTVTGTIYSDLDIVRTDGSKNSGTNRIKGRVNNGEELIVLSSVSGNIYMRKG